MSALPPELAPWAEALAAFAPELVGEMAGLARRLDQLVGRVRLRPRPRGDDPEGYDGLDRRGPYDRLLLSEWALADELPDEFDRRAASGEHAFLRLDRRDRSRAARTLALFDGGPDQLGAPRVVQLVVLIVLWRRAMAAGGDLRWGVVQGATLAANVDRASIQGLLGGRSSRAATAEDVALLRAGAGPLDELWVIGPHALGAELHLAIADVIEPGARAVDVRLCRGGVRLGDARLALPAPDLCRRMLVDPFAPPVARPPPTPTPKKKASEPAPDDRPQWAPLARLSKEPWFVRFQPATEHLMVCAKAPNGVSDRLLSWNFDRGKLYSPKPSYEELPSEQLVALGRHRQKTTYFTHCADGRTRPWYSAPYPAPPGGAPRGGIGTVVTVGDFVAFTDGDDELFMVVPHRREALLRLQSRAVLLFRHHHRVLAVIELERQLTLTRCEPSGVLVPVARLPGTEVVAGSLWGPNEGVEVLMTRSGNELRAFRLGHDDQPNTVAHAPTELNETQALLGAHWDGTRARAVLRHSDGTVRIAEHTASVTPTRTPRSLSVSPDGRVVAWCTPEGFLEAWSLETGDPLLLRYSG